jgi:hypothetical protein
MIGEAEIEPTLGTRVPEPDNAGVGIEFGQSISTLSLKPVPLNTERASSENHSKYDFNQRDCPSNINIILCVGRRQNSDRLHL